MSQITAIKPQKNKKRVNVYLDGKFGFGLDLENFVKLHLKIDQELSDEEVTEIVKKAEFQKSLDRLLNFATLRPRSEKEIKDYFRRKEIPESIQEELINRLIKLELLNDEKFAKWWVDQRLQFKNKSKKELIQELRIKGINNDVTKNTIEDLDISDEKTALKLVKKRQYRWRRYDEVTKRQKISQYLASKGFDWGVIKTTLSLVD